MLGQSYAWLSKLWSLFGSLLKYGTYYLVYPKGTLILTTTRMNRGGMPLHRLLHGGLATAFDELKAVKEPHNSCRRQDRQDVTPKP